MAIKRRCSGQLQRSIMAAFDGTSRNYKKEAQHDNKLYKFLDPIFKGSKENKQKQWQIEQANKK